MTDTNTNIGKQNELIANTALNLVIGLQQKQPSFLTNNNDLIPTKDAIYNIGNNDYAWKSVTADGITILGNSGEINLKSNIPFGGSINLSTDGGDNDSIQIVNQLGNKSNAINIETINSEGGITLISSGGGVNISDNNEGTINIDVQNGDINIGQDSPNNINIGNGSPRININGTNININGIVGFSGTVDFTDSDVIGLSGDGFNGKYKATDIELNASGSYKTTIGNLLSGGTIDINSATDITIQAGHDDPSATIGNIVIQTTGNSGDKIQIINSQGTNYVDNPPNPPAIEIIAEKGGIGLNSNGGISLLDSGEINVGGIYLKSNNDIYLKSELDIRLNSNNITLQVQDGNLKLFAHQTGSIYLNSDNDLKLLAVDKINIGNEYPSIINIGTNSDNGSTTNFKGTVDFSDANVSGLSGGSGFDGTYNTDNIYLNSDIESTYATYIGNATNGAYVQIQSTSNIILESTKNESNAIDLQAKSGGIKLQSTSGGVNINTNDDGDATYIGSTTGGNIDVITQDTLTLQSGNNGSESNGKIILRTDGFDGDFILINNKYGTDDSDNKPIEIIAQSGSITVDAKNNVSIKGENVISLNAGNSFIHSKNVISLNAGTENIYSGIINLETNGASNDFIGIINKLGNTAAVTNTYENISDQYIITEKALTFNGAITIKAQNGGIQMNSSGGIALIENGISNIYLHNSGGGITLNDTGSNIGKPGNIDIVSGGLINGKININTPQRGYSSLGTTGINLINIQNVYDGSINIQSGAPSDGGIDYRGEIIIKTTGNGNDYLNLATKGIMKFDSDNIIQINDTNNGIIITESGNGSIIAQATGSGSVIINSTGGGITIDDTNADTGTIYIGNSTASIINIGNDNSIINLLGTINNLSGSVYQGVFDPNYNATDINLNTSGSSHQTNIGNTSAGGSIDIASSSEVIITSGNVLSSGKISLETTGTTNDIISIINSNGNGIGYFIEDNDIIYTSGNSAININANGEGAGVQLVSNGGGIILAEQNGGGIAIIEQGGGIIMNTTGDLKLNSNNKIILDSGYANDNTGSIEILTNGTSADIIKINSKYSKLSAFKYNNGLSNNWFEINKNISAINLNTESKGGGITITSNEGGIAIADMAVKNGGGILLTETGGENGGIGIIETGLNGIRIQDHGGDGIHIIESGEDDAEISIETNNMGITITDSLLSIGGSSGGINIDGSDSIAINIGNNKTSTINIGHSGSLINLYGTINFTSDNITESSFTGIYDGGNIDLNTNSSFGTTIGNTLSGNNVSIKSSNTILLTTSSDYNEAISLYASTGGINIKSSGGGVNISDTISSNSDAISLTASGSNGGVTIISNGGNVTIDDIASGTINIGDSSASIINIGVHTPSDNTINIGNADSTIYIAGSLYNGGGGPGGSGIVFPYNVGNVELNNDSASIFSTTIGNTESGGTVNINSANEITLLSTASNSDYQDSAINLIAGNGGISLSSNSVTRIDSFGIEISSFYLGTYSAYMSTTASNISISNPEQQNGNINDNINIINNIGNLPAIDLITNNINSPGTSAININAFSGGVQITSNTGGIALYEYSSGGIVLAESGGGIYISENGGGIEIVDQGSGNINIDSTNGIIGIGNAEYDSYYSGFKETTTIYIGNSSGITPSVTTFFGDVDFSQASSLKGLSGGSSFSGNFDGTVNLNTTGSDTTTIGNGINGGNININSKKEIYIASNKITMVGESFNINTIGSSSINIGNTDVLTTFKGTVDLSSAIVNSLIIPPKSSVITASALDQLTLTLDNTYSGQIFFIDCSGLSSDSVFIITIPLTPGFKCTIIMGGSNDSTGTLIQIKGPIFNQQIFYGVMTRNISNITKIDSINGNPGAARVINFNGNSNIGDYVNIDVLDSTHVFVRGFSTGNDSLKYL